MANRKSFGEFFEGWEVQHRGYLDKLLLAIHQNANTNTSGNNQDQEEEKESESKSSSTTSTSTTTTGAVVEQVLSHYQEYYDAKSKAAESQDIFIMFSPPWFSSLERTLLWATGFKPSVMFRLVRESVGVDLNQQQKERIALVSEETRRVEREITEAMASVQESVAAPPLCGWLKRDAASLVDGQVSEMENAVKELKGAMMAVMRDADYLRQHTALQVLEVLTPPQKLKFLAGTSQFWLQSRRLGMERDTITTNN